MKYSILILTLLMFCITGRSQVASGREDRAYWISYIVTSIGSVIK